MSRRNVFLLFYALGVGAVICLFLGVVLLLDGRTVYAWFEKALVTQPSISSTAIVQAPTQVPVTPSASATATPTPMCGGPPTMILTLLGLDSRADSYYAGLADSIRLVRVDFIEPGVMVLPFPRDLYVEIPGLVEHGITHGKLNQGYTYGTPAFGYIDEPNQGLGLMAKTMEYNFDVHVDNGIAINLQSFIRIVDVLGGIDIYLPYTVDGRVEGSRDSDLYFEAGNHHLDGYRTQLLARLRPNGDIERTNMQNRILQVISLKLLSPAVLSNLPELINASRDSIFTDLEPVQIAQLTCLASRLDQGDIVYVTFPEELFQGTRVQDPVLGNTFVWDVDFDVLQSYLEAFKNGTWPDAP